MHSPRPLGGEGLPACLRRAGLPGQVRGFAAGCSWSTVMWNTSPVEAVSVDSHMQREKGEGLEENIGPVAVRLTAVDLREIESAASKITAQVARYPENLERITGR